jgi:hypothetical protein
MTQKPTGRPEKDRHSRGAGLTHADRPRAGGQAEQTLAAAVERRRDDSAFKARIGRIRSEDAELLERLAN